MHDYQKRYNVLSKAIATVLLCLFLVSDIGWAQNSSVYNSLSKAATLATQSIFKPILDAIGSQYLSRLRIEIALIADMALRGAKIETLQYRSSLNINAAIDKQYGNDRRYKKLLEVVTNPKVSEDGVIEINVRTTRPSARQYEFTIFVKGDSINDVIKIEGIKTVSDIAEKSVARKKYSTSIRNSPTIHSILDAVTNQEVNKDYVALVGLQGKGLPFIGESAGVNAIAGYLKHYNEKLEVGIFDMQSDTLEDVIRDIKEKRPAILGISVKLKCFEQLLTLYQRIQDEVPKQNQPLIIIGNTLPNHMADLILKRYMPNVVIGFGEGEVPMDGLYKYPSKSATLS